MMLIMQIVNPLRPASAIGLREAETNNPGQPTNPRTCQDGVQKDKGMPGSPTVLHA